MVGGAGKTLEWVQPETTVSLPEDSDRCFKIGLGSSSSWGLERWAMDVWEKSMSHQLPRVVGSISSNWSICEEREASDCVPLHGQCLSFDLHQQEGWCPVPTFHSSSKRMLWVVHWESNCAISRDLPGCLNVIADEESRHMGDHWDWRLHPGLFQRIVKIFVPIEVDLFASRLTYQVPRFFSWNHGVLTYLMAIHFFMNGKNLSNDTGNPAHTTQLRNLGHLL